MVETNKEKKWLYRGTDTRKFSYMKDWSNKSQFHAVPWNVSNDHHTSHSLRERKYMDADDAGLQGLAKRASPPEPSQASGGLLSLGTRVKS